MSMRPLEGVRVADFTLHAAGPYCTHLLSLLGAEVIKIETRERPDIFRRPHPVYGRMEAASFDQVAANKRSITLNLKDARGADLARRLVAISEIVAESFRPGVMDRLGLGYAQLAALRPGLVMVSVSSAGQTGPERGHAGYAPLFGAAGGLGTLTGYEDGPPVEIRHVMDHSTGLNAACATLAAYFHKRRTGQGQHVDVAAQEVASAFIGDAMLAHAATGASACRRGNDDPAFAPHGIYRCRGDDAWLSLAVRGEAQWRALCAVAQRPEWATDARFVDHAARRTNRHALDQALSAWSRGEDAGQLAERLQAAGVAAHPSYSAQDIVADRHLASRGAMQDLASAEGSTRRVVGPPWRFSRTPARLDRSTPALGEANRYVLGELLGVTPAEIERLIADKVVY